MSIQESRTEQLYPGLSGKGQDLPDVAIMAQRLTHGYVEEEGSRQRKQNHCNGAGRSKLGMSRG